MINHSCVPNATLSWVMGDFQRKQVRAIMVIEKNEEILSSWQNTVEFIFGSREFRQQQVLEAGGFLCQCSECSLEADDLEENEKMRTEIKEKETEIEQLLMCGESHPVSRRSNMKKVLKLFQKKTNMVKNLNLRTEFVTAMIEFYRAAIKAKSMKISCKNDPDIYKQEALKYAKMFGDIHLHLYNKFSK